MKDKDIYLGLDLSRSGLRRILALPEYQREESRVLAETLAKMDAALEQQSEMMKGNVAARVPEALRSLVEEVMSLRARHINQKGDEE